MKLFAFLVVLHLAACSPWPQVSKLRRDAIFPLPTPPAGPHPTQGTDLRLPRHLIPSEYDVEVFPRFDRPDFPVQGHVMIRATCTSPSDNVTLHASEMTIDDSIVYRSSDGSEVPITGMELLPEPEFLVFFLGETLEAGSEYVIEISFSYVITNDLNGLYLVNYDEGGETKYMAVTDSEPHGARKIYPCFDEPSLKAVFTLTLGREETWVALANMPLVQTTPDDEEPGIVWDSFQTSVVMPTYLVCFAISQFGSREDLESRVPFRSWARMDLIPFGEYILTQAPEMIEIFEETLEIPYALPKMDLIALPQFPAGAMENWGLVTYMEPYLLSDTSRDAAYTSYVINSVNAHELAHQWFGNLVTLDWWTYLWLNEGFASRFQYMGMGGPNPGWDLDQLFIFSEYQSALMADSLEDSLPVTVEVQTLSEIFTLFSTITYSKGACLVRLMEGFLGNDVFLQGIKGYLGDLAYANAANDDLWAHLQTAADAAGTDLGGHRVEEIMAKWSLSAGYPLIRAERDYAAGTVALSQERFFSDPSVVPDPDQAPWVVPVPLQTGEGVRLVWFADEEAVTSLDAGPDDYVLLNADSFGFYRVEYDSQNWALLAEQLERDHAEIPVTNRAQLIDDAFTLVSTGALANFDVPMSLTKFLKDDGNFLPWATAAYHLEYVSLMFLHAPESSLFRDYILSLVAPRFQETPFETLEDRPEFYSDVAIWLYADVVQTLACTMEHSECVAAASDRFQSWKAAYDPEDPDGVLLSPNGKPTVYVYGVFGGDVSDWEFAYQHHALTGNSDDKELMLLAMATSSDSQLLLSLLADVLSPDSSPLDPSYGTVAFRYVAGNPVGRELAFEFLEENWAELKERYNSMGGFVSGFRSFNTQEDLARLTRLMDDHPDDSNAFTATIGAVERNIQWMESYYDSLVAWLTANAP